LVEGAIQVKQGIQLVDGSGPVDQVNEPTLQQCKVLLCPFIQISLQADLLLLYKILDCKKGISREIRTRFCQGSSG
jgi:hypothetical protein